MRTREIEWASKKIRSRSKSRRGFVRDAIEWLSVDGFGISKCRYSHEWTSEFGFIVNENHQVWYSNHFANLRIEKTLVETIRWVFHCRKFYALD
jgi:hypothetical protein